MQTRALHRVWRVVLSHQALMALVLASVRASFYSSTLSFTLKLNSRHDESRSANWTSHGRRPRVTQGVGCRAEADTPPGVGAHARALGSDPRAHRRPPHQAGRASLSAQTSHSKRETETCCPAGGAAAPTRVHPPDTGPGDDGAGRGRFGFAAVRVRILADRIARIA
jgi:hypothetical protein